MLSNYLQFDIDTKKTILCSSSVFYKTEDFIKQTKYVSNIDFLLSKLCENIAYHMQEIVEGESEKLDFKKCYLIETSDKGFSFMFKLGYQLGSNLNKYDIIFFNYIPNNNDSQLSIRVDEYVKYNSKIRVTIRQENYINSEREFVKLYFISNISGVNLPRLNDIQKEIVETVDKNMLVQGVAGSGKTNICIDKIIFTACKNYTGKTLYTTFSRGLLIDTKLKVENFKQDLIGILNSYNDINIVFLDNNHKKALENRLGIYFFSDDDNEIFKKIEKIVNYLENKVDYLLIEDIYKQKCDNNKKFIGQNYFIKEYCNKLSNHQIERCFQKLQKYSREIIFKEIYGMILGYYSESSKMISLDKYIELRQNSFSRQECESIYYIALDYCKHCEQCGLIDNNIASREIVERVNTFEYSLSIIDEVQDYTQVNLNMFKKISLKMFCVGDALQMINPSYFSFGYLKKLMYEKDVTFVKQLQNNYRNSAQIEKLINALGDINKEQFGTHNFVLKGQSVDNAISSKVVYVAEDGFGKNVANSNFDNFTFVVNDEKSKKELRKVVKNQEVLTVSDIKGLERSTVVAYNILSDNADKWNALKLNTINHKTADENSVFRYYYNLFYVAISRAKQNIFVVENKNISQFESFFNNNFQKCNNSQAVKILEDIVNKVEFTQDEMLSRVKEFLKLEQFDNAKFTAMKIKKDDVRINMLRTIDINENYIQHGKYREAGIKFWEYGLIDDAKKQFVLSGDEMLIELIDSVTKNNHKDLNIDIIDYYEDVKDNKVAQDFILETVKKDVKNLKNSFHNINENFKKGRK